MDILYRELTLERGAVDEAKRTVRLAFASETPVERWGFREVLEISPQAVDLSRLNNGGALLVDHDSRDQVGVVERAQADGDRIARAVVRFGTSARANEIFEDVKNGIRRLVSVGYRILKRVEETGDDGIPTVRATSWQPVELSIVAIPADASVGVGRSVSHQNMNSNTPITFETVKADVERKLDVERHEINAIATRMARFKPDAPEIAKRAIGECWTPDQYRKFLFENMRPEPLHLDDTEQTRSASSGYGSTIGLNSRECENWSLLNLVRHQVAVLEGRRVERGLEVEASEAYAKQTRQEPRGIWIPPDVLTRGAWLTRDLTVGTATTAGNLKATELHAEQFISLLRNRMMVTRLGATILSGLQGDFVIPRQSGANTAQWMASETATTTATDLTVDQVTLAPKTVTGLQNYTKQLLIQSSLDVENMVRNDLVSVIAIAIDNAALNGTGSSGQPTGIRSISGIGDVAGGTNGAAPTWTHITNLEKEVEVDNAAMGRLAYLINSKTKAKLKQTLKFGTDNEGTIIGEELEVEGIVRMNGHQCGISNQVPSNLTKGTSTTVASAIFFGNWADLLIGQWSGIDILIDPYTGKATRTIKMYADAFVDIDVRHPESWACMLDALSG